MEYIPDVAWAVIDADRKVCRFWEFGGAEVPVVFGTTTKISGYRHVAAYVDVVVDGTTYNYIGWYAPEFPDGNVRLQKKDFLALAKATRSGGITPPLEPPARLEPLEDIVRVPLEALEE